MKYLFIIFMFLCAHMAYAEEVEKEVEDKTLIPVRLEINGVMQVEAKLTDLKPEANALGLNELTLEGTKKVKPVNGSEEVEIIWNKVYISGEDGQKKQALLDNQLHSEIVAKPNLAIGDTFTAEGSLESLFLALQKLKEQKDEKAKEEEKESEAPVFQPQAMESSTPLSPEDERELRVNPPAFEIPKDPVITHTTDGCPINVDIAQMAAIVQERVLQDGEEVSPCEDTLTRYPISKEFTICPLYFDDTSLLAYEQFILKYTDPDSGGAVEVQSCTQDEERVITLTEDTGGCSLRHDFANNQSVQQSRIIYTHRGKEEVYQSCTDTDEVYEHIMTEETCSPIVDQSGGIVTFQNRRKINKDGVDLFISDCQPDISSRVNIEVETCTTPKYTHDLNAGQSYLNKTYYYTRDGERVNIESCVPSTETYIHKQDETQCSASHDDVIKKTTLNARAYIDEDDGTKVYINQCSPIDPKIDYIRTGGKWRQTDQTYNAPVTFTGSLSDDVAGSSWESIYGCCIGNSAGRYDPYRTAADKALTTGADNGPWNYNICSFPHGQYYFSCGRSFKVYGKKFCLYNDTNGSYIVGNKQVDRANSDANPLITLTKRAGSSYRVDYDCSSVCSVLTTVEKNSVYQRGDASIYTDISIAEEVKLLCGYGTNLIDVVEP